MNSAIFLLIFVGLYSSSLSATGLDKDATPEDYVIDAIARYNELQREQNLPLPHHKPSADVGYNFNPVPPHLSTFAVNPSDPRYHQQRLNVYSTAGDDNRGMQEEDGEDNKKPHAGQAVKAEKVVFHRDVKSPAGEDGLAADSRNSHLISNHERGEPVAYAHVSTRDEEDKDQQNTDIYFVAVVAGCSAAAVGGIVAAGICWYRLQKNAKAAADVEYPAYGITGPNKELSPTGDRKLAQSAQMYHYQHQKQQMLAMENVNSERQGSTSDVESEEENEEGDYTVYECPGLAPTGEMEVKNPLFQDDPTPAAPATHATQQAREKQDQDQKNKEHSEK